MLLQLRNDYITSALVSYRRGRPLLKVTVDYLGSVKQSLGLKQAEQIELKAPASVLDLLHLLADSDLKPYYILSINGLLTNQLNDMETELKDGDRLIFMPVVTGG
jgi:molybdopterin converting factor small subunit